MEQVKDNLKNNRVENTARNIVVQTLFKGISIICPFILRTLMLRYLGAGILGLHNVFQTILNVLSTTEMGFGQVMVFFLFKPLANGNSQRVNAILSAMARVYHIIGIIIGIAGFIVSWVLPWVIEDAPVDSFLLRCYFLIYLFSVVLQYFLFEENGALLIAVQRIDIQSSIAIVSQIVAFIIQLIAITVLNNYVLYLVALILQVIFNGICRKIVARTKYSDYYPEGNISKDDWSEIKSLVGSMVGHQLDTKLFNTIDNLFIGFFIGLNAVVIYGNYYFVITAVSMFMEVIFTSILSAIGNAVVLESKEGNFIRFRCIFFLNALLTGWMTTCLLCTYQTFMSIWMENYMLADFYVILFCLFFYISQIRKTVVLFKNATGLWREDKIKPYISMAIDLFLDIFLIQFFGLIGAIVSSIVCVLFIEIPWETNVLFKKYFREGQKIYFCEMIKYLILNIVLMMFSRTVVGFISFRSSIASLLVIVLLCSIIVFGAYYLLYRQDEVFKIWRQTVFDFLRSKRGIKQ